MLASPEAPSPPKESSCPCPLPTPRPSAPVTSLRASPLPAPARPTSARRSPAPPAGSASGFSFLRDLRGLRRPRLSGRLRGIPFGSARTLRRTARSNRSGAGAGFPVVGTGRSSSRAQPWSPQAPVAPHSRPARPHSGRGRVRTPRRARRPVQVLRTPAARIRRPRKNPRPPLLTLPLRPRHAPLSNRRRPASSITGTPSAAAFSSFEPASDPAST